MIPIDGQPIVNAAEMRAAEAAHGDLSELMERAGAGVADAVRRLSGGAEALILCGPGNNGGDGYVAARLLRQHGHPVRVAALTPPRTALAKRAAAAYDGPVAHYTTGDQTRREQPAWNRKPPAAASVLVDAVFGTGGREGYGREPWIDGFLSYFDEARFRIAVDLPFGLAADGAEILERHCPGADVTLAVGALKPAHVLAEVGARCGQVRLIDLGLDLDEASVKVVSRPLGRVPDRTAHKYTRGVVAVVAGTMPGAAILAATAAARAGAGYVTLFGDATGAPAAIVNRPLSRDALLDRRIDAIVVGPGLGRDDAARDLLEWLVTATLPHLIVDGDALHLLEPEWLRDRGTTMVLTPHAGEMRALAQRFPTAPAIGGDPFGRMMAQAGAIGCGRHILVAKGATTVIAGDSRACVSPHANPWLSTAGTGDVLAGAIAATVANARHHPWTYADRVAKAHAERGWPLFDAVAGGVWLHATAARTCGASFIADDLAAALTSARGAL